MKNIIFFFLLITICSNSFADNVFYIKNGKVSPDYCAGITNGNIPVNLKGCSVYFLVFKSDSPASPAVATKMKIMDERRGYVKHVWSKNEILIPGKYIAEMVVVRSDDSIYISKDSFEKEIIFKARK